ncbi:hypothetical protein IQ255_10125 [Pleurocapsales cyanobacterium LEGE 10410]|nr:hypothetical protein [Pleurocapsales cyanobacterium LEGE 10410]
MLQQNNNKVLETEEKIAREALKKAYERETSALIASVRDRAGAIAELQDLWYLHDLLSTKRYEIDGKYEYNPSTFMFDFAQLVKEGWLHLDELEGLKPEIQSKISALARM